jgi:hypothetical protein
MKRSATIIPEQRAETLHRHFGRIALRGAFNPASIVVSYAVAFALALCVAFSAAPPLAAAADDVGYVDFGFGSAPGNDPTADKPQSKLWHNDGAWWAVMFHQASGTWHIYRLSWPGQWLDTGTVVDDRPASRADVLWAGGKLYVASLVRLSSSNVGRLYRYSYNANADTYTLDDGFPTQTMSGRAETLAFDRDSTGQLWITYTQSSKVYVNRSTTSDTAWGTPFVVPGATNLDGDDISSLVAYQGNIGVLWSNQRDDKMYFSYHRDADPDDLWQPIIAVYSGTNNADDHINLKSLQTDGTGRLFAATKTSRTGDEPGLVLLWRDPDGQWGSTVFGTATNGHTRPLVLLDSGNRTVYMFATAPTGCGTIYMKSTSIDAPDFSKQPGLGTPFIKNSTYTCLNNVTSTKQTLSAATGMVVLASDESKKFYLHNAVALADTVAPAIVEEAPAPDATGVDPATNVAAGFSEDVTGVSGGSFTLRRAGDPTPIPATVTYDAATRTATLNPSTSLDHNADYTVALGSPIADLAGNPLAPASWSFTTAGPPPDTTPPEVTGANPPDGANSVGVAANIVASFSEALDPDTIDAASFTLTGASGPVAATVSYNAAGLTATLDPIESLTPNEFYTVRIDGARDLAGNPLAAPVVWSFMTAPAPTPFAPTYFPIAQK